MNVISTKVWHSYGLRRWSFRLILLLVVGVCFGCASIDETHYFKSSGENPNYFRLTVDGGSGFSSSRYIAGYYDERSLDLFLNEFSVKNGWGEDSPKIFKDQQKNPGANENIKPLDPTNHGAFVMILSTNADAIAETIGAFSQSYVVADVLTKMSQKGALKEINEEESVLVAEKKKADATKAELTKLISPLASSPNQNMFLRILQAISRGLGSPHTFQTLDAAETWLETVRSSYGDQL